MTDTTELLVSSQPAECGKTKIPNAQRSRLWLERGSLPEVLLPRDGRAPPGDNPACPPSGKKETCSKCPPDTRGSRPNPVWSLPGPLRPLCPVKVTHLASDLISLKKVLIHDLCAPL